MMVGVTLYFEPELVGYSLNLAPITPSNGCEAKKNLITMILLDLTSMKGVGRPLYGVPHLCGLTSVDMQNLA